MNTLANSSILISPQVAHRVQSIPEMDRKVIIDALASELVLGINPKGMLSPLQRILYTMIKSYIKRDSLKKTPRIL